jgi:hypothetical protein
MVTLLFVSRILVVVSMYYALQKGRKDWSQSLFIVLFLLTFIGYSLDGNWFWAALHIVAMLVVLGVW